MKIIGVAREITEEKLEKSARDGTAGLHDRPCGEQLVGSGVYSAMGRGESGSHLFY